jgi:uncharacterized protein (TIGR02231 family)
MRARLISVLALLFPLVSRAAPDVDAPSRIDAVTVYRSSARVTRLARVELPGGDARVVLRGLPAELDDDAVRVEGKGGAHVRLHGVSVERVTGAFAAAAEAREAEARLERLTDEDGALQDREKTAQARARFVESLRSTYSEERAKNLAVRPVAAKEWKELSTFVESELAGVAAEQRAVQVARRDVKRRMEAARAELDKLAAKRGETTKTVSVDVTAEQPTRLELAVSYVVRSAGWQPVWDARLAPETATVELAFHGSVWQRTGEDWNDVKLAVSTAQPGRGLFVPVLETHWLDRVMPVERFAAKAARGAPAAAAAPAPPRKKAARDEAAEAEPEAEVQAVEAAASIEEGLLAATFTAPRRERVDGAGQAHKIPLARFPLKAELTRTAAPRLDKAAFLTAKTTNDTGVPLLPGSAAVYVGGDFVGRAPVPFTPPGGELKLAFGADDRVEIERRVLERKHDTSGLLDKKDVWRYRVRVGVKSRWQKPVALTLLDLVPVARDAAIEVAVLDASTKATRDDPERPGVRSYELELLPGKERVVELAYEVRVPRGFPLAGLE